MPGTLIISLDYELFWGVYDSKQLSSYREEICGVHQVFPEILALFHEYDVKASIAFVGSILFDKKVDLINSIPPSIMNVNGAGFTDHVHSLSDVLDEVHADQGILERILEENTHELASHTHTHYYCDEPHSSVEDFKDDMSAFKQVSEKWGVKAESFVFPRNQVKVEYLRQLKQAGYKTYRGNPSVDIHKTGVSSSMSLKKRVERAMDSYINMTGPLTFIPKVDESGLVNVPASFFLRPVSHHRSIPSLLQLRRIKNAMTHAANENECIHIWWHPHNFGRYQRSNLLVLREILVHFDGLRKEGKFENLTMAEIGASVIEHA